ncbi:hypothetical protein FRB95_004171 [Tulasnella sp. JGI-2019a]|nr:hypothetical protein FRB95_004171 [Tulasnella sp. JGI-2019a]
MSVHDDPPPSSFTGLPSIPQLPPITLPATPSMESFTTALSSTSADDGMRHIGTHDHQRYAAPHALTASSSMSSLASPVSPRSRSGSANASQDHSRLQPPATSDISDLSDFENTSLNVAPSRQRQSGTASSVAGTDDRNRNTPTPTYYTKNTERSRAGGSNSSGQASGSQGIEQHRRKLVNRWDSEREDPAYNSATAATRYNNTSGSSNGHAQGISRGATQRDSHASFPVPPLLRAKLSLSSAHLRGATTTSSKALRSTNSTFPLSSSSSASGPTRNARSPTIPNSKREAAALLPPIPMPPPPSSSALLNRPLPSIPAGNGTGSTKGMDRMRSASLLEIMNSATGRSSSSTSKVPTTHSASPKDSKPSATSSTSRAVSLVVPEFSILVVGAPKSGKSTLISKGLKPWSLESEKTIVLGTYHGPTSSSGASSSSSTYPHELVAISRIAHVAIKSGTFAVEVIEVSSQELIRCGGDWPQVIGTGSNHTGVGWGAGKGKEKETTLMDCATGRTVDGLVVCYDANDGESWKTAKVLLGHASLSYVGLPIQAIVVACKSDTVTPPVPANHTTFHPILSVQSMEADKYHIGLGIHPTHRHPPGGSTAPGHHSKPSADSDEITERGGAGSGRHSISTASVPGGGMMDPVHKNLGLVSVSGRTVEGKKKMRDAFNWLFRRIERGKKNWASSHQPRSERGVPQGFEMSGRDSALSYNPSSAPNRSAAQSPVSPATTTTPVGGGSPRSPLSAALSSPSTSGSGRRSVLKTLQSPIASNSSRARSTSDLVSDLVGGSGRESGTEKERSDREMRSGYGSGSGTGGGASDGMRKSVLRSRAGSVGAYLGAPPPNPAGLVALPPPPPFPPPEPRDSSPGSSEPRPRKSSGSRVSAGPGAYTSTSSGNDRASQGSNRAASQSMDELGSTSRRGSMHHLAPPGSLDVGTSQAAPPANITMNTILRTVKEPPPLQYATLDELIDKLVFLAVTDDDPVFVEQFLLVYRRFATPRALLLGLQKRIRALSSPSEDQLLAKFAQMRVCALLEDWMMTYPGDFASPGAEPALQAIVRQILSNSHTAHYAVDFVPFLKCVPKLVDEDKDWAAKGKTRDCEDDGPNSDVDPAEADVQVDPNDLGVAIQTPPRDPDIAGDGSIPGRVSGSPATPPVTVQVTGTSDPRDLATESHDSLSQTLATSQQDGASSIGLETHLKQASASSTQLDSSPQNMAKEVASSNGSVRFRAVSMNASEVQPIPEALVPWFADMGTMSSASRGPKGPDAPPGTKANLKELKNASNALAQMDPTWVGQEITRLEVPLFRAVQPRDWLRHGTSEAPGTRMDPVLRMARFYNYLSMWTTSLIVVHDKARHQCKTIEIFTKIAWALRKLNNYSGLRAVVTGINNSKPDNSPVSEMLAAKPEWVKSFKVLEVLLGTARMHGSYRMALKNTPDAAIVSMEVHSYDLVRADDVNPDHRPGDPTQIHWGKFSLIAKMILSVVTFQRRFEDTAAFSFPERPDIRELIVGVVVMDEETVWARHALLAEPHATAQGQSDTGGASSTNRFKQIFARGK